MSFSFTSLFRRFSIVLLLLCAAAAQSNTIDRSNPQMLLKQATDELLAISKAARDYVDEDRQRYYDEVATVLDQVIDKSYFARGVMATYASARLYRTLQTEQEQNAFKRRIFRFAEALQEVLIEKYADALLAFEGERIELEPVSNANASQDKAIIKQTIYDKGGSTYEVQYILNQRREGVWMISNVIVEGINLGATYRNQFADEVEKHKGDVDYVVNHWKTLMTAPAKEQTSTDEGKK